MSKTATRRGAARAAPIDVPEHVQRALDRLTPEDSAQAKALYERFVSLRANDDVESAEAADDIRQELADEFSVSVGDAAGEQAMAAAVEQITGESPEGDEPLAEGDEPEGEPETAAASAEGATVDDVVVTFRAADGSEISGTLAELREQAEREQVEDLADWLQEHHPPADGELELREEQDGQQAIPTESTVHLTTRVDGPQPLRGVVRIKGIKMPYFEDLNPGDSIAVISHVEIGEVTTGGEERVHHAEAVQSVELETDDNLSAREAIQAVHDLKTADRIRRVVIDQMAAKAAEILEEEAPESPQELALKLREWAYPRWDVANAAEAHAVTYGVGDDDDVVDGDIDEPPAEGVSDEEWEAAAPVVDGELPEAPAAEAEPAVADGEEATA
jgi:hypothetical protein